LNQTESERGSEASALVQRHLVLGWTFLLVFLTMGLVLEVFHGFKVRWYVDVQNSMRRLMFTLAHSHGVLIGLVSLGFALTTHLRPDASKGRSLASTSLFLSGLLLPGGFLLGGLVIHQGDPGIGVFLTPIGGFFLFLAAALTVRGLTTKA
jgi:hypothetical protein